MFDIILLVVCVFAVYAIVMILRDTHRSSGSSATSTSTKTQASRPEPTGERAQMIQDIKSTKTSRVVDEVDILDDLGTTMPNFRQYCELVGTSMTGGGVVAPYSRREVAYYDVRCYRIDRTNGQDLETLVAHEHSIEPFWFKDPSCDTPVYVDLDTFGDNIVLVNSTDHIEGPNSDFSKAVGQHTASGTSAGGAAGSGSGAGMAIAGRLARSARAGLEQLLLPGGVPQDLAPALAGAGFGGPATSARGERRLGSNLLLAGREPFSDMGRAMGRAAGKAAGRGGADFGRAMGNAARMASGMGRGGAGPIPANLDGFLRDMGGATSTSRQRDRQRDRDRGRQRDGFGYGGPYPGSYGGPAGGYSFGRGYGYGRSATDQMLDIGLGMLLGTLQDASRQSTQQTYRPHQGGYDGGYASSASSSEFLGYRLVENVVPLASPVYCIGEIYRSGTQVHMGRSLAKDYTTSYFATKPEAELLSTLQG